MEVVDDEETDDERDEWDGDERIRDARGSGRDRGEVGVGDVFRWLIGMFVGIGVSLYDEERPEERCNDDDLLDEEDEDLDDGEEDDEEELSCTTRRARLVGL